LIHTTNQQIRFLHFTFHDPFIVTTTITFFLIQQQLQHYCIVQLRFG
jgi:hypothetical protein